jgi:tripartite-type tricarboxylate transporter receptor subunit TctC
MKSYWISRILSCTGIFGLAVAFTATAPALAQDVSFKDKTLHVLIGAKPGGGTSGSSRLVGSMIVRHLPGKPKVIFQNMPGGGGIKATNYFYNVPKPDGLTILGQARSKLSPITLKRRSVKYDPRKFKFIGGTGNIGSLVIISKEALPRLTNKSAKPVVYGAKDPGRTGIQAAVWGKEYLGWNVDWVVGYEGSTGVIMAARRGEADMVSNQHPRLLNPLLKRNMVALTQIGQPGKGGMIARDFYPKVPVFSDMIRSKLDKRARKAFDGWLNDFIVGKWFVLPPKTPAKIVKIYRAAYQKMVKDPAFIKKAKSEFGDEFAMIPGEELQKIATTLAETSDEDLNFFLNLMKKHKLEL